MYRSILDTTLDPFNSQKLSLTVFEETNDRVIEGYLENGDGDIYPIINSVPCFLKGDLEPDFSEFYQRHDLGKKDKTNLKHRQKEQSKTNDTFSDKWRRFTEYGLSHEHQGFLFDWYQKKYGVSNREELAAFYAQFDTILECGPGSGFHSKHMAETNPSATIFALDVSEAAFTTQRNTSHLKNCNVVQADLNDAPFGKNQFDFVVADGVLHHTPDTHEAVRSLYAHVKPGGKFFFYVYRQMGAARYFVDQHIRGEFKSLTPEDCYKACEPITDLGRELSKIDQTITLNKPIDVLGIPAGEHNIQRLFYYNFVKCFWNDAFDYETNNMVNFDWYHPHNAWQHTDEEVIGWVKALGVSDYQINDSNPNGISMLLTKPL